jgi:PAS domain S-box-containing protein
LKKVDKPKAKNLRQKAEMVLKKKPSKVKLVYSEAETLELIHELEVHQIELEMQNDELIQAKELAEVASKKYFEFYDFAPSGYLTLSKDGDIIEVNHLAASMLGKQRRNLVNNRFALYISNETQPIFNLFFEKLFNSKVQESCEVTLLLKDNLPMYVKLSGIVINDGGQCLLNMVDISERKMAEEEIKRSWSLLQSIIESQKDTIIFSIDKNYHYLYCNKAHKDYMKFAYNIDVEIGMNILECITMEEDRKVSKKNYDRALKGESHSGIRMFRDKESAWYESFFNPIMNEQNKIVGATVLARNITERMQVENKLKESEDKFQKAFYTNPDAININRLEDSMYVSVNDGFTKITGYSDEDVIGKTSLELNIWVNPEDRETLVNGLMNRGEVRNLEARFRKKNGEIITGLMSASLIELNGISHVITITKDITEFKKAEQKQMEYEAELKRSNVELENFAYVASHDLQEPLRMVSSFLKLLEGRIHDQLDKTSKEYIHFATDGAARMKILVHDLLDFSRVGTNREPYTAVDLNEVMKYIMRVLQENIDNNRAVITIKPMPVITANKTLMNELFINLVNNALKYHDDKEPEIEVGYTENANEYIFYVKDNGIGIAPEFQDRIFTIFQRLHTRKEFSGTGIGLAICKKIVDMHKGKIWVKSEVGKGSTFYFTIPKKNDN